MTMFTIFRHMRGRTGREGQSLVEAMIAISIFTTGFSGNPPRSSAESFFLNRATTDQTKATYLAEEGIELAKNFIDYDVYAALATPPAGTGWGRASAPFPARTPPAWNCDYTMTACGSIPGYTGRDLLYNPGTHLYGYTSGGGAVATNFTRKVLVTQNGQEITVNSIVQWKTGPITQQTIDLEDHFYNWHP